MRVLVTGATGFTGASLVRALSARGDTVFALHRPSSDLLQPMAGVQAVAQDLTAPLGAQLPPQVDAVVHLAQSRRFRDFPDGASDVFDVNAAATVRLLEWSRAVGATTFIYASSGAVYAPGPVPLHESVSLDSPNFYAASKRCGEIACEQFRGELKAHVLRFFFIYGPGQRDMFIPGILDRVRLGREIALAGEQGIRVNPIYIDDAVDVITGLLGAEESKTMNVAGPEIVSLREIGDVAGRLLGRQPAYAIDQSRRPDTIASIDLLRAAGFEPRIGVSEGLERTVAALESAA